MSRGKETSTTIALTALSAVLFLAGCIFSPDKKDIVTNPPPTVIRSAQDVIDTLEFAYQERDLEKFQSLLAPEYQFFLANPEPGSDASWDYTEEVRIHRRMFRPQDTPFGEAPVPAEYWLQGINISLSPVTPWEAATVDGLDTDKWRATQARFSTYVYFDTQTDNDFKVEDEAVFTVIEDLTKPSGATGKFFLLWWQDVETNKPGTVS